MVLQMPAALALRQADAFDASALAELRAAGLIELGLLDPLAADAFLPRARHEYWTLLREDRLAAWMLQARGRASGIACVVLFDPLPNPQQNSPHRACAARQSESASSDKQNRLTLTTRHSYYFVPGTAAGFIAKNPGIA